MLVESKQFKHGIISHLPCTTGNTEILYFRLYVVCCFANKHIKHVLVKDTTSFATFYNCFSVYNQVVSLTCFVWDWWFLDKHLSYTRAAWVGGYLTKSLLTLPCYHLIVVVYMKCPMPSSPLTRQSVVNSFNVLSIIKLEYTIIYTLTTYCDYSLFRPFGGRQEIYVCITRRC